MDPLLRRRRTLVLTAGVTVMTVSGALIGATLKSRQQLRVQEDRTKRQDTGELSVDEQIALLESAKRQLTTQREQLENKIAKVREQARKKEEVEKEKFEKRGQLPDRLK